MSGIPEEWAYRQNARCSERSPTASVSGSRGAFWSYFSGLGMFHVKHPQSARSPIDAGCWPWRPRGSSFGQLVIALGSNLNRDVEVSWPRGSPVGLAGMGSGKQPVDPTGEMQ
jgi:hypothetical protein